MIASHTKTISSIQPIKVAFETFNLRTYFSFLPFMILWTSLFIAPFYGASLLSLSFSTLHTYGKIAGILTLFIPVLIWHCACGLSSLWLARAALYREKNGSYKMRDVVGSVRGLRTLLEAYVVSILFLISVAFLFLLFTGKLSLAIMVIKLFSNPYTSWFMVKILHLVHWLGYLRIPLLILQIVEIIFAVRLGYYLFFAIDKGYSFTGAIKKSWVLSAPHGWSITGYYVLMSAFIICCNLPLIMLEQYFNLPSQILTSLALGLYFVPLAYLAEAYIYKQLIENS